jgi:hypothetical protein
MRAAKSVQDTRAKTRRGPDGLAAGRLELDALDGKDVTVIN